MIFLCQASSFSNVQSKAVSPGLANEQLAQYLHCHREVVLGLWGEEYIHCFLWKWLVASWWGPHFDDVQLGWKGTEDT